MNGIATLHLGAKQAGAGAVCFVLTDTVMPKHCKWGLCDKNVKQKRALAQKGAFVRTVQTPLATGLHDNAGQKE